jgi:hypothetical protein
MTCEHCGADMLHRTVRLELDTAHRHYFCSDGCERNWMLAQLKRWRRFLNRIFVSTGGRAREVAKTALFTNDQP